jgi:hypothetical protein
LKVALASYAQKSLTIQGIMFLKHTVVGRIKAIQDFVVQMNCVATVNTYQG